MIVGKHNIRHLYVTGDSYAAGQGLMLFKHTTGKYDESYNVRNNTYGSIISDKWDIPVYTNTAIPGSSNDRMLRVLLRDIPIILKDTNPENIFVNISLTHSSRTEFFSSSINEYIQYLPQYMSHSHVEYYTDFWKIKTVAFNDITEHLYRYIKNILSIQMFLEKLGIKYIITRSLRESEELKNLIENSMPEAGTFINYFRYPPIDAMASWCISKGFRQTPCRHTAEEGHAAWAEYLINYIEENNIV